MRQKLTYLCGLAALVLLAACQNDDLPNGGDHATGTAAATFHVFTRAAHQPDGNQEVRLYVAERRQENDQDELYASAIHDVSNGSFLLERMTAQWYKLAFIAVPDLLEEKLPAIPADSAFNDLTLDYSPVLARNDQPEDDDTEDLAIYRTVIDRWLMPDERLTEDVTLKRITGRLILDMGILNDQFPTRVTEIKVELAGVPSTVYLHDQGNGEIICEAPQPCTYTYEDIDWDSKDHFRACFNLLPYTIGTDDTEATVTVTLEGENGTEVEIDFPLVQGKHNTDEANAIEIKPNVLTTVYFRGMESNEFEVRYAGFDGMSIEVEDEWNGWK